MFNICLISDLHHGVNEVFTLLGCYALLIGSYQHFVQPIGLIFKGQAALDFLTLEDGTKRLPKALVTNYQSVA
jgi:hypothetical protein